MLNSTLTTKLHTLCASLAILVFSASLPSLTYAESNQSLMKQGMWQDPATGLVWMRCAIGQEWTGSTCTGTPSEYDWDDAFTAVKQLNQQGFAGHTDWRLPTIEELISIRQCSKGWRKDKSGSAKMITIPTAKGNKQVPMKCAEGSANPVLDSHIFPAIARYSSIYWSASPDAYSGNYVWGVNFGRGSTNYYFKTNNNYVRAVRSMSKK